MPGHPRLAASANASGLRLLHDEQAKRHPLHRGDEQFDPARASTPNGRCRGFTRRFGLKRLVYFEVYDDIRTAIQREKNIKHWSRAWKVRLIVANNPEWGDLYDTLV